VLGNGDPATAADIVAGDLIASVGTHAMVDALAAAAAKQRRTPTVHIKVSSGMGRNGVQPAHLARLVDHCRAHNLHVEGLFTHFANSWDDEAFTVEQTERFLAAVERLDGKFLVHAANSGGLLRQFAANFDITRAGEPVSAPGWFACLLGSRHLYAGIAMYGLPPDDSDVHEFATEFQPILEVA
jgi:alanine racemase